MLKVDVTFDLLVDHFYPTICKCGSSYGYLAMLAGQLCQVICAVEPL